MTKQNRKISVVIPAYNEEKTISHTLESLLKQKVFPSEIIVVDNNSSDKTNAIAKSFRDRFSQKSVNLIVLKEPKQGVANARNAGFNKVSHPIVASTDADSVVSSSWIESINHHFKNYDSIAVTGKILLFDAPLPITLLCQKGWYKYLHHLGLLIFGFMGVHTANCAIKKECFQKVKGFNGNITNPCECDDFEISSRLSRLGNIRFDSKIISSMSYRRYNTPKKAIVTTLTRIKSWLTVGLKYRGQQIKSVITP